MRPEATIWMLWPAWLVSWMAAAVWSDRAVKRLPIDRRLTYRLGAVLVVLLLFGLFPQLRTMRLWHTPAILGWALAAVVFAGLIFTWWARIHLGRLWSSSVSRKAHHHVVDSGPYAIVRHPIYTGLILAMVATALVHGTAVACLAACLITFALVIKAGQEEGFLRAELGAEAYDAYARRVPMLAPIPRRSRPS